MFNNEDDFSLNSLVCLLQDMQNLFVYWDFSAERDRTVQQFLQKVDPGARICLRLYENNTNAPSREIHLESLERGNYYFREIDPEHTFLFELGIMIPNGAFVVLARTDKIDLQPKHKTGGDRRPRHSFAEEKTVTVVEPEWLISYSSGELISK